MADFRQDQYNKYYTKLEKYRKKLPSFVNEYIVSLATKSIETQSDYCYNIVQFFEYFVQNNPALNGKLTNKVSKDAVNQLRPQDINEYIAYLINERRYATASVQKTVTVLNCLFSFLEDSELIDKNPMRKSMKPRTKEQLDIVHLPRKDMDELQDVVATGKNLTRHRKSYHEKTRLRDEAIVTLFLKTGIRVSECAGIRMCDVDFEKRQFKVRRKGYSDKNQQPIDMSKSVYDALLAYYEVRKKIIPLAGHEEAFFLSLQRKRMSIAGIQRMVKKYALDLSASNDIISPHKLRASYATALYDETNDIYLVSAGLNHKSVDVTVQHYTAMDAERRKKAYTTL